MPIPNMICKTMSGRMPRATASGSIARFCRRIECRGVRRRTAQAFTEAIPVEGKLIADQTDQKEQRHGHGAEAEKGPGEIRHVDVAAKEHHAKDQAQHERRRQQQHLPSGGPQQRTQTAQGDHGQIAPRPTASAAFQTCCPRRRAVFPRRQFLLLEQRTSCCGLKTAFCWLPHCFLRAALADGGELAGVESNGRPVGSPQTGRADQRHAQCAKQSGHNISDAAACGSQRQPAGAAAPG